MANEEGKYPKPMSMQAMVLWTGLFGGIFWGIIGYIAHLFNFTEVPMNIILEPLALGYLKHKWLGTLISLILYGIFSTAAAYIYYAALKKFKGMWVSLVYGLILFIIVFLLLNPLFPGMKSFTDLSRDTIITSVCIYILYGLFVGYSINYEYQNKKVQMKEPAS